MLVRVDFRVKVFKVFLYKNNTTNPTTDTPGFLARSMDMDDFIRTVASICDAIKGEKHNKKTVNLSFAGWNVWYHSSEQDKEIWKRDEWSSALSLLEDMG